ncbi:MAG TPA: aminotransferase class IV [Cyclobacteriaceae bacterium]|nr:aminotransferase class IV [Cyclobacteriaceae bacterium]
MYRFIETIRLEEGKLGDLTYHQARMDSARMSFFEGAPKIRLKEFLDSCPMPSIGLHKVRLVYDKEIQSIQISHYTTREIKKLKLVFNDSLSYSHKFENRTDLEKMYSQRTDCDDIIIVKGNTLTDASFANIVFKKKDRWFTPATYLLNGTMRQQLLDRKLIFEDEITISDLFQYQKVKLINSMLLFNSPEIDVSQIVE